VSTMVTSPDAPPQLTKARHEMAWARASSTVLSLKFMAFQVDIDTVQFRMRAYLGKLFHASNSSRNASGLLVGAAKPAWSA
jgi:hypothetical protein